MFQTIADKIMDGVRTPGGKIVAFLLAAGLLLVVWNVAALSFAVLKENSTATVGQALDVSHAKNSMTTATVSKSGSTKAKPVMTTIEYLKNDGTDEVLGSIELEVGQETTPQETVKTEPQRDGFAFLGWSDDPDAKEPAFAQAAHLAANNEGLADGEPNALYAIWEPQAA